MTRSFCDGAAIGQPEASLLPPLSSQVRPALEFFVALGFSGTICCATEFWPLFLSYGMLWLLLFRQNLRPGLCFVSPWSCWFLATFSHIHAGPRAAVATANHKSLSQIPRLTKETFQIWHLQKIHRLKWYIKRPFRIPIKSIDFPKFSRWELGSTLEEPSFAKAFS